jgi:hypothetical protein
VIPERIIFIRRGIAVYSFCLRLDNNGQHQSPPSKNSDRLLLRIGSETWMCEQNVHITLRFDDTAIELSNTKI